QPETSSTGSQRTAVAACRLSRARWHGTTTRLSSPTPSHKPAARGCDDVGLEGRREGAVGRGKRCEYLAGAMLDPVVYFGADSFAQGGAFHLGGHERIHRRESRRSVVGAGGGHVQAGLAELVAQVVEVTAGEVGIQQRPGLAS